MSYITNADIVPAAIARHNLDAGNFWTENGPVRMVGYLPARLVDIVSKRRAHITQVIYSYRTPIAWKDSGVWIWPDVTYSATTSVKHQTHLYQLGASKIPFDAGMDEYLQVLAGKTRFIPNPRNRAVGTYVGVPN